MFGGRFFGKRFFGARFWGDGDSTPPAPVVVPFGVGAATLMRVAPVSVAGGTLAASLGVLGGTMLDTLNEVTLMRANAQGVEADMRADAINLTVGFL